MFENPKYISNSIVITFNRQKDIRRKQFEMEDKLKELYCQPQVISIPDDLDPEMPRLIFSSKNGYSQIVISQLSISLNVRYSEGEWQEDIVRGKEYLLKRISLLFELLNCVNSDLKINFLGFNTKVYLPYKGKDADIIKILSKKYLSSSEKMTNVYNLSVKSSRILKKQFFSNVTIKNYKLWDVDENPLVNNRIGLSSSVEKGLEIFIDYNDRYSFNYKEGYYSKKEKIVEILEGNIQSLEKELKKIRG